MVCPSGLTSSESQVPLEVVNSAFRVASRGSGFRGGAPGAPAAGAWAASGAARSSRSAEEIRSFAALRMTVGFFMGSPDPGLGVRRGMAPGLIGERLLAGPDLVERVPVVQP